MNQYNRYLVISFYLLLPFCNKAQHNPYWQEPSRHQVDSLKNVLRISTDDTVNMYLNRQIGVYYQEINRMTALAYFEEMLKLARKTKQKVWEAEALSRNGYVSCLIQNYSGGLKFLLLAQNLASKRNLEREMWNPGLLSKKNSAFDARMFILCDITNHLGLVHYFSGDYSKALQYHYAVRKLNEILNDDALTSLSFLNMGEAFFGLGQLDSAEASFDQSIYYSDISGYKKYKGLTLYDIGRIYEKRNNKEGAKKYYRLSIKTNIETESPDFEGTGYQALADIAKTEGDVDSLFYFSRQALNIYQTINDTLGLISANSSLSAAFDISRQTDSAYHYLKTAIALKDGLNKEGRIKSFQLAGFNEQMKLEEQKAEQLRTITTIRTWSFIAGIAVLLFVSSMIYRNYRRQRKDKHTIEQAYAELKSTQSLLIQSEKMASLGELTAGIAHEIQNPLNFVNNFSDVNSELLEELKIEAEKGNLGGVKAIASDLVSNEQKINHHGKRADAIVKGMLQHSRTGSGAKEPSDINRLADEYVRLAYQGFRARDKSFNATFSTEFDNGLDKVNIIPQEIGRVILNLINNAFYAVNERAKQGVPGYEPTVIVGTRRLQNRIEISVKDNGNGISPSIKDKIFQPFFTTKPAGQGTGLGLSLSYDIVKAHGGELKVETKEGEGSEFIIRLPA
jgi:two-component system, NtrC family, sensor kinase